MNLIFTRPSKVDERLRTGVRKVTVLRGAKYKDTYNFTDDEMKDALANGFLMPETEYNKREANLEKRKKLSKQANEKRGLLRVAKILDDMGYQPKKK